MKKEELEKDDKCYNCGWLEDITETEDGYKFCEHFGEPVETAVGCSEFEFNT